MAFRTAPFITKAMMRAEPKTLFVFGDNMRGSGRGGQASVMRGMDNAVGIPTKWIPTMTADAFFSNDDLPKVRTIILRRFARLSDHLARGGDIVWPEDGIGTGRAKLREHATAIWDLIEGERLKLQRGQK
jgi:hypothetical protein